MADAILVVLAIDVRIARHPLEPVRELLRGDGQDLLGRQAAVAHDQLGMFEGVRVNLPLFKDRQRVIATGTMLGDTEGECLAEELRLARERWPVSFVRGLELRERVGEGAFDAGVRDRHALRG